MKVKYSFLNNHTSKSLENSIDILSKEKPLWWKNFSFFILGYKKFKDLIFNLNIDHLLSTESNFVTIKACPAMHNLFQKSLLLKWPCDTIIETYEDGSFKFRHTNSDMSIEHHSNLQLPSNLSKEFTVLKIGFSMDFSTSENCCVSFVDPILYKDQPYKVSPGIMNCFSNRKSLLKVICFFPKKNMRYFFESGEPLSLMQFDKNITGVAQSNLDNLKSMENNYNKFNRGYVQK